MPRMMFYDADPSPGSLNGIIQTRPGSGPNIATRNNRGTTPMPDAEHVASYPPAYERHPNGGAYVHADDQSGHHVYFMPGAKLDSGPRPSGASVGTGMTATMDGHRLRPDTVNPVLRAMNAKNRRAWSTNSFTGR